MSDSIFIGGADTDGTGLPNTAQRLLLNRANRHGIVAGATGTGKTVTLQILAEGFSLFRFVCVWLLSFCVGPDGPNHNSTKKKIKKSLHSKYLNEE